MCFFLIKKKPYLGIWASIRYNTNFSDIIVIKIERASGNISDIIRIRDKTQGYLNLF